MRAQVRMSSTHIKDWTWWLMPMILVLGKGQTDGSLVLSVYLIRLNY